MSDDTGEFTYRPVAGRRRVSMFVAVPVVAGCAALGTMAGVIVPLRSPPEPGDRGAPVLAAPARPGTTAQSAGDDGSKAVMMPSASAVPASGVAGVAVVPTKDIARPQAQPVSPQPVRTISEDSQPAPPRPPVVETGSVDQRLPRAGDDASAAGAHQHEAARGEPRPLSDAHAQRLRAKKMRKVYVRPLAPAAPATPALPQNFNTLVPPQ